MATVAILLFIGLDIGVVVAALLWLSNRRSEEDTADVRYVRERMRRRNSLR